MPASNFDTQASNLTDRAQKRQQNGPVRFCCCVKILTPRHLCYHCYHAGGVDCAVVLFYPRWELTHKGSERFETDGFKNINFRLMKKELLPLYTKLTVELLDPDPYADEEH